MFTLFRREIINPGAMFAGHYIEVKAFYAWHFNKLPCINFIGELDVSRAYSFVTQTYQYSIEAVYQHAWYEHTEDKMFFNNSIFVLGNDRMIEMANDNCQVLFAATQYAWANSVVRELAAFRKGCRFCPSTSGKLIVV
jgi:hypothetical protein